MIPMGYTYSWADCAICNHAWMAVYPAEAEQLECPGCGYMNAVPDPPDRAPRERTATDDWDAQC